MTTNNVASGHVIFRILKKGTDTKFIRSIFVLVNKILQNKFIMIDCIN